MIPIQNDPDRRTGIVDEVDRLIFDGVLDQLSPGEVRDFMADWFDPRPITDRIVRKINEGTRS